MQGRNHLIDRNATWVAVLALIVATACGLGTSRHATAQSQSSSIDQNYRQANPALYDVARSYFPSDAKDVAPKRIFRLTRDQLDATVASLLPEYYSQSIKSIMSRDPLQTNYEYAELLGFNAANSGAIARWISDIVARVQKNPTGVTNCSTNSNATPCLKAAAETFVMTAFRGDVSTEKLTKIIEFYLKSVQSVGLNQATADLVEIVLSSPDFLFRKETEIGWNNRLLAPQLLQSITYTIADAPPAKLKLDALKAPLYFRTNTEATETITSIVSTKEARDKLMRFFKTWLEIKEPGEFTISQQIFPEFNGTLAAAMLDETDRFLSAQLSKPAPSLKDITQSTESFVPKALEPIYKTPVRDPRLPTALDPAQRLGIFSQPAVIASHSGPTDTRLVKRGVFWARKVMCMELEPAPKELNKALYDAVVTTERRRIEDATAPAACVGCHKVINPFGFFQESYDALGRWRTKENGFPIDSSIAINFLDEGKAKAAGPVDALKTFTKSAMFKQCFVRQLFRFYMGRSEEPSDDPLLRRMFFEFANNDEQNILKAVYVLAVSDRLVRRQ